MDAEFGSVRLDVVSFLTEVFGLSLLAGGGFGTEGSVIANDAPIRGQCFFVGCDEFFGGAGDDIEKDAGHEGAGAIRALSAGEALAELGEREQGTLTNAADFLGDEGRSGQEQFPGSFGVIDDLRFHVGSEFGGPGCAGCFHGGPRWVHLRVVERRQRARSADSLVCRIADCQSAGVGNGNLARMGRAGRRSG